MIAMVVCNTTTWWNVLYTIVEGKFTEPVAYESQKTRPAILDQGYKLLGEIQLTDDLSLKLYLAEGEIVFEASDIHALEPLNMEDDRLYAYFDALPFDGETFTGELVAYDRDKDRLFLPGGIKRFYRKLSEAQSVALFLNMYVKGRSVKECTTMFGVVRYDVSIIS